MGTRPSATTLEPEMTDAELSALKSWVQDADLKGAHLEIGTAAGGTLCFLMKLYPDDTRPSFSVVDTMSYFPDQQDIVSRNLTDHGIDAGVVDFRVKSSDAAFREAEAAGDQFDFILVDASHKIRYVMDDLRWMRLLNPGGIACFHDYAPRFKGVRWPIDRFLRRNPHFARVGQADSLLCLRKDRAAENVEVSTIDRLWARICSPILQWDLSLQKRRARKTDATNS